MEKVKDKKNSQFVIISILAVLILLIAGTYAWLAISQSGTKSNDIVVGNLSIKLGETLNGGIKMENAIPMTDYDGMQQQAYTFTITNDGNIASNYIIYLDDIDDKKIPKGEIRMEDKDVKYQLIKNNISSDPKVLDTTYDDNNSRVLDQSTIEPNDTNTYELRFWIKDEAVNDVMSKIFSTNIRVEAEQIKE